MRIFDQRTARSFAAIGFAAAAALALQAMPSTAQPPTQLAQSGQTDIDDAAIETFVEAARAVVALRREYEPRLESAANEAAARNIIDEARGRMNAAITDAGMTLDRYLEIAEAAQNDPTLRARLEELVGIE